jgi:putative ABC transport system ATP-binding protein
LAVPENHSYIQLERLSKGYQEGDHIRAMLRGADAEFARGGFVAILGRSGSAKSTLLNLISGIDMVDEGKYQCGRPRGHSRAMLPITTA